MYEINPNISMDTLILQILPNAHQEDLQLLLAPAQDPRKGRGAHGRHALGEVFRTEGAEDLVLLAARPRVDGHVEDPFRHVFEADFAHVGRPFVAAG